MDNNNIKFVGHAGDRHLKNALRHRNNPMDLETFFTNVNQAADGGCSCCKQDTKVYCIMPIGISQIKPTALALCAECCSQLPTTLTVINVDSCGAPPALIYRWCEI